MENSMIVVTNEQKRAIREKIKISDDSIKNAIENILEWYKKQQHLPRIDLDTRIIEYLLIGRKGSVEQTKQKIDMMFSIRNVIPELGSPRDVICDKFKNAFKGANFITLPKLNHGHTRISIVIYKDPNFLNIFDICNFIFTIIEYRLLHDYSTGERYLVDMKDFNIGHLTKYTPSGLKNIETWIRKGYGFRIFGFHIINGTNILNRLLTLLKSGLSEKIGSRLYAHDTYKDMYKCIDKDILPIEYGGREKSFNEKLENWIKELSKDENREYLLKQENWKSNEALRIGTKLDEEILGIPGTFRKLNVD